MYVEFGQFIRQEFKTAAQILKRAGLDMAETAGSQLSGYLERDARAKDARVVYDIRGDFGLDPDELHERFSFYYEAFPQVTKELV